MVGEWVRGWRMQGWEGWLWVGLLEGVGGVRKYGGGGMDLGLLGEEQGVWEAQ